VDVVLGDTIRDDSAAQFMREVGAEYSWWGFVNPSHASELEPSAASQLCNLDIPILVLTSDHDLAVCREIGDFIVSTAPNSRHVVLKDTGHLMHIERPSDFNAELLAFFAVSP
jgi:pimeloyl-ACP methyl ester carboxylesterase